MPLNESIVEDSALEWFGELGYTNTLLSNNISTLFDTHLPQLMSGGMRMWARYSGLDL